MPDTLATEMINREKSQIFDSIVKDSTKLKELFNRKGLDKLKVKFISTIIAKCDDADQKKNPVQHLFDQLKRIQKSCQYNFRFLDAMHGIHKSITEGNHEIERVVYDSFGVSLLDGLELFNNFSSNYCLVKMSTLEQSHATMHKHLMKMQGQALSLFSNKKLLKLYIGPEFKTRYENEKFKGKNYMGNMGWFAYRDGLSARGKVRDYIEQLETSKELIGLESVEFPIACDLDKDLYLVPKQWVKEGINECLSTYCYQFAKQFMSTSWQEFLELDINQTKKVIGQTIKILGSQKTTVRESIEIERKDFYRNLSIRPDDNSGIVYEILHVDYDKIYSKSGTSQFKRIELLKTGL